jgi:hypothetical protein
MDGKAMPISRQQLVNQLLPALDKLFGDEYAKHKGPEYHVRSRYGKYSIYKWEFKDGGRSSSTLAKHLSREEAIGMMKLLKDPA